VTAEPTGFGEELELTCVRKREIKDNSNVSGWNNWTRL
jgi:hypothetical protein